MRKKTEDETKKTGNGQRMKQEEDLRKVSVFLIISRNN